MPRVQKSPIVLMLAFFRESSLDVAKLGLDLAKEIVQERTAAGHPRTPAEAIIAAGRPLAPAAPVAAPKRRTTPAGTKKLTEAQKKEAARAAQRVRDQRKAARKKKAKAAEKATAAATAPAPAAAKKGTGAGRKRRIEEIPGELPPQDTPVVGDLDFAEDNMNDIGEPLELVEG